MNPSEPRLEIPMSMKTISIPLFLIVVLSLSATPLLAQDDAERLRQEEAEDYYEKWLREDVKYIITDEEKAVFRNLTTPEEKEQFIEQFWFRRDPDPRTPVNEFKDEHYRRIAYANERRSEERRVGKECRYRRGADKEEKNKETERRW